MVTALRVVSAAGVLVALTVGLAPPLSAGFRTKLIYPFEIGSARSLPWGNDWWHGRADYPLAALLRDTETLLTPSTPIVVRLETLRRAVVYASRNRQAAARFLTAFEARAAATLSGTPDALAVLDAAFVSDALWQIGEHSNPPLTERSRQVRGLVSRSTGYARIAPRLEELGASTNPSVAFAAALLAGELNLGGRDYTAHVQRARMGALTDPLLAINLNRIYADRLATPPAVAP